MIFLVPHQAAAGGTDSLISALNAHPGKDAARVTLLTAISESYVNSNTDSAIIFANEGLSVSQTIGYEKGTANCQQALGLCSLTRNEYEKAFSYFDKSLAIFQRINDQEGIGRCWCYTGSVYAHEWKNGTAIEYYKKSLELSRKINDVVTEALSLVGTGSVYAELGDYSESLKFYLNALTVVEKGNDTELLATCLSNIASTYSELGNYKMALGYDEQCLQLSLKRGDRKGVLASISNEGGTYGRMQDYRKAIEMLTTSVKLADSIGDKYFKNICLANIGEAYYSMGAYDTACSKYAIALHEAELTNDLMDIAQCENGMGSILVKKGKIKDGIKHLLTALDIVKQSGLKEPAQDIAINLSGAYEQVHDLAASLKYYKIYSAYTDSLYREKSDKRIQKLQFDYELGKKENEISLLEKDKVIARAKNIKQSAIIWTALSGLAFLIVVTLLLYRSRAYEKRNKEKIFKQKEEIQMQATKLTELNTFKDKTFSVISHDLKSL